jgi:hypothetical protein
MDAARHPLPNRLPLPGTGEPGAQERGRARTASLRRIRRMSNWTAAALLVGTGAGTAALATHAFPVGTSATTASSATTGSHGATAPHVGGTVVTSGGSGSTVTTTTRVVNGKTVVTQVRHPAAYHDH